MLPVSTPDEPPHPGRVLAYLGGLLPEAETAGRNTLAARLGVATNDVFALLAVFGLDVIGAVTLTPEDAAPSRAKVDPITDDEIAERLRDPGLAWSTLGTGGSSLPGVQHKLALHRGEDRRWYRATSGGVSTHILKPEHPSDPHLVDNEAAALRLATRLGLTTVNPEVVAFGTERIRALVVERFDRVRVDGAVERVHQEDAAQALGLNPNDLQAKFQRGARGPRLRSVANLLTEHGGDVLPLLQQTVLSAVVGNTDAHAKNLGLLHHGSHVELSPAYDTSPHLHHGSWRPAISIGGCTDIRELTAAHLVDEGRSWRMQRRTAMSVVHETLDRVVHAVDDDAVWQGVDPSVVHTVVSRARMLRRR